MSRTRKPCPGCNVAPVLGRDADSVCSDCKLLIEEALEARARKGRSSDLEIVDVPFAAHGFPSLGHVWEEPRRDIQEGFFDLVVLLGSQCRERWTNSETSLIDMSSDRFNSCSPRPWYLPRGLAAITARLYQGIIASAEEAYNRGKTEGHQLIVGLAKGTVSIDTFNNATIGREDED